MSTCKLILKLISAFVNKENSYFVLGKKETSFFSLQTFFLHHFINYKLLVLRAETEIKNLYFSISFHQKH